MHKADDEVVNMGVGGLGNGAHSQAVPREISGWDVYNNEAKKVDTELVNDWRDSLNSLLLFAAIFAAVLTAFIIESKRMLEQDPTGVMVDVMIFYTNSVANGTHSPYSKPEYQVESSAITINCLFFASLSASLVAALASVVALQWVADYDAAITRGGSSPEDRAKRRQFRYAGVVSWKMGEIIAAIPLLLYCSVVLFFGGLILWMWTVHYMVGAVVIAGAVIAGLFYGISTTLAVVFVSAPFKTPLSRWIYSLIHLFISLLYHLSNGIRASSISAWLQSWLQIHAIARKREDVEVNRRDDMGMKALIWLANQLSISPDSYRQLLLLVGELPKLKPEQFLYHGFKDAPWYMIFDLLGWHNLKMDHETDISQDEMYAVSILAQCYKIPEIYDITRPTESMVYITDDKNAEYWSQCCGNMPKQWFPSKYAMTPNSTFLLLRDVPLPLNNNPREVELTIRLSRWRNMGMNIQDAGDSSPNSSTGSSSSVDSSFASPSILNIASSPKSSHGSSLVIVQPFFKDGDLPSWQSKDNKNLYIDVVERLVSLATEDKVHIQPGFLDLLRLQFESLLMEKDVMDSMCLRMPLRYKRAFYSNRLERSRAYDLHITFTLLLARSLRLFTGTEKTRRMKELIVMLWARYGSRFSGVTDEPHGLDAFFDTHKSHLMKWIELVYDSTNIYEILHHLAVAQSEQPEFGSLWRVMSPRDADPRLVELLSSFDRFIGGGVTPDEHLTLITLICQDLELGPPEAFEDYFSPNVLDDLEALDDPCLKFLALFAAGLDAHLVALTNMTTLKKSWARIAQHTLRLHLPKSEHVLRHQASVWAAIPSGENGHSSTALRNPELLAHLRRVFEYHIPCTGKHCYGEAHLLLHIFEEISSLPVWFDTPAPTTIPMSGNTMNALLLMLIAPSGLHQSPADILLTYMDRRSLSQVLALLEDVRMSQFALLTLLSDVCSRILEDHEDGIMICAEEIGGIVVCIRQALDLPDDFRILGTVQRIVERIEQVEAKMHEYGGRSAEERAAASTEARMIKCALLSRSACMKIQGFRSSSALCCARSRATFSPALGWLSPFVD